jgi:hypothetical protein
MKTENLELLPHAPRDLRAMIRGPQAYRESFGHEAADGLTDFLATRRRTG